MVNFSLVVPVYNIEKYLYQCVNSIFNQTLKNYEVILINDGSTDNSGKICDEIASAHDNVTVIHKKNGGLSDARNIGLTRAKGEYIVFIDSDDYIELGSLEKFQDQLEKSQKPDVMITKIKKVYPDANIKFMDGNMPVDNLLNSDKEKILEWMFSNSNSLWPAVRYVVKNELIKKNNLEFAVGYFHEDIDWTSKLFLYANKFTILNFYWYNHRMERKGSITNTKNAKRTLDVIELVSKNINNAEYYMLLSKQKELIFTRLVKSIFYNLGDYKYYSKNEKELVVKALILNKDIFKYTSNLQHRIFIMLCNRLGFKAGLSIMSFLHR